jgi:hypothetical protein
VVDLKKRLQSPTVVVMPMGHYRKIHRRQIHPQPLGIVDKSIGLTHIKEDFGVPRLQIKAKPMLAEKSVLCGILH